jgi:hypothetical protein
LIRDLAVELPRGLEEEVWAVDGLEVMEVGLEGEIPGVQEGDSEREVVVAVRSQEEWGLDLTLDGARAMEMGIDLVEEGVAMAVEEVVMADERVAMGEVEIAMEDEKAEGVELDLMDKAWIATMEDEMADEVKVAEVEGFRDCFL